jgi:hypothetical protein
MRIIEVRGSWQNIMEHVSTLSSTHTTHCIFRSKGRRGRENRARSTFFPQTRSRRRREKAGNTGRN